MNRARWIGLCAALTALAAVGVWLTARAPGPARAPAPIFSSAPSSTPPRASPQSPLAALPVPPQIDARPAWRPPANGRALISRPLFTAAPPAHPAPKPPAPVSAPTPPAPGSTSPIPQAKPIPSTPSLAAQSAARPPISVPLPAPRPRAVPPAETVTAAPGSTISSPASSPTENSAAGEIALIGVFHGPDHNRAFLRLPDGRFIRAAPGDKVNGWRVGAIGADTVTLARASRKLRLKLFAPDG